MIAVIFEVKLDVLASLFKKTCEFVSGLPALWLFIIGEKDFASSYGTQGSMRSDYKTLANECNGGLA